MKDWQAILSAEADRERPVREKKVLEFLAGGAVKFGNEQVQLHWTDHGSLLLAHNARIKNRHLIIGVCGVPSTLGMLTVMRDTIISMFSRLNGKRMDANKPPGKILWAAPKADMSQIFRRAVFSINGSIIRVRGASNLVSLDLLEQTPSQTTVAFLRDFWRIKEALMAHTFETIVIDDPFGQVCNTADGTSGVLQTIFQFNNHPTVVAIVPLRALPDINGPMATEPITVWPWTAELGPDIEQITYASEAKGYMSGSTIKRSQIVFDVANLLPPTIVLCEAKNPVLLKSMEDILKTSSRLAQETYKLEISTVRRLVYEARATALNLESLCMPVTIHEATNELGNRQRGFTITERLNSIQKSLFNCSTAIRDDLSILHDRMAELLYLMKTEVPKWNRLVCLLNDSLLKGYKTAVAVPNTRTQEALLKALTVQFPKYKEKLPWEICTTAAISRLGEIDELILVGMPTLKQSWLLRYPVCAERKLLVWPFHKNLGIWLAAPILSAGAEAKRINGWRELSELTLDEFPDRPFHTLPRVGVLEGDTDIKAYYDIPQEYTPAPFLWASFNEGDDLVEEEKEQEDDMEGILSEAQQQNEIDFSQVSEHLLIHFKDGGYVYALEEDRFEVIKGEEVFDAAALALECGQLILMIRGQSYIKLRNMLMDGVDKKYNGIWLEDDWNKWREMCRQIPRNGKSFQDFVDRLRNLGCDKDKITIRGWLTGKTLAPSELIDIRRMAIAAGDDMMIYYSHRFNQGIRELRGRHKSFGKWLKRIVINQDQLNAYDVIDPDLDFTVGDLSTSVTKHEIVRIEQYDGPPPRRTGEVIKRT